MKFFPDIEVGVGQGDITGDDDIRREDISGDAGADSDVQQPRAGGLHQGVQPLHVVCAGTEISLSSSSSSSSSSLWSSLVGPGEVDDRYRVDSSDGAGNVEMLLIFAGDSLRTDEDLLRRI